MHTSAFTLIAFTPLTLHHEGEWSFVTTMSFPASWGADAHEYLKNEDPYLWEVRSELWGVSGR
jgi:hypothetical protein